MHKLVFNLIVMLVFVGCKDNVTELETNAEHKPSIAEDSNIPVNTLAVSYGDFPLQLPVNGIIHASRKAKLHFSASGAIQSIDVKTGELVEKGQLIATLENAKLRNQLSIAKESYNAAMAELNSLLLGFTGGRSTDTTMISADLLSNLKAQSGLNSALLQVAQARLSFESTYLYAPYPGRITGLKAQPFDHISSGESLCTLINEESFVVKFHIIESEIGRLKRATHLRVNPINNEELWLEAYITEMNLSVDEHGLMQVSAQIRQKQPVRSSILVDGMNARVIVEELVPNQIIVPKQALVMRNNREVIFSAEKGRAKWNYVKIAHQNSTHLAISEGLNKNDSIIVSGNLNLAHDAKIKVIQKD